MQAFNNIGVLATWTGLIFLAWLLVREQGMKDKQLSREYIGLSLALIVIWIIGSIVFLLTPGGIELDFFLEGFNYLLFVPMGVIVIDIIWQSVQMTKSED